jgi:uncharacterized protein
VSKRSFRVGRSVTGLGLFATAPFKKGEFVVRYTGRRIADAESKKREARGARYMFEINSHWAIDGSSRRNLARYVNHSCRPNVETAVRKHRVLYIARRRIKPDEEITVDYGKEYFDAYLKANGCRCAHCREKRNARRRANRRKKLRALSRAKNKTKNPASLRSGRATLNRR